MTKQLDGDLKLFGSQLDMTPQDGNDTFRTLYSGGAYVLRNVTEAIDRISFNASGSLILNVAATISLTKQGTASNVVYNLTNETVDYAIAAGGDNWQLDYASGFYRIRDKEAPGNKIRVQIENTGSGGTICLFPDTFVDIIEEGTPTKLIRINPATSEITMTPTAGQDVTKLTYGGNAVSLVETSGSVIRFTYQTTSGGGNISQFPTSTFLIERRSNSLDFVKFDVSASKMDLKSSTGPQNWQFKWNGTFSILDITGMTTRFTILDDANAGVITAIPDDKFVVAAAASSQSNNMEFDPTNFRIRMIAGSPNFDDWDINYASNALKITNVTDTVDYIHFTSGGQIQIGAVLNTNGKSINESEGASVASAATTDIWNDDGNTLHITGVVAITSFGTAPRIGAWRKVIFDGILTLTDGANINLPGGANITTAVDDFAWVYAETTALFKVIYHRADGTAVVSGGSPPFIDSTAIIKGSGDDTKLMRIEVDGLTTGTTRVLTMPDKDITLHDNKDSRTINWNANSQGSTPTAYIGDMAGNELENGSTRGRIAHVLTPVNIDLTVNPVINIPFFVSNSGSGNADVRMSGRITYIADGELVDKTADETILQTVAVIDTLGELGTMSFTLDASLIAAGDSIALSIERIGGDAADTYTGKIAIVESGRFDFSIT